MPCIDAKTKNREESAISTFQLYLLLQAWLRKQEMECKKQSSRHIVVREWFID